jgi:hypothetical protein
MEIISRMKLLTLLFLAVSAFGATSSVMGEVPAWRPSYGQWTVAHTPVAIACYRNGSRQANGSDFTISGRAISSKAWLPTDKLACDYSYAVANPPAPTLTIQTPTGLISMPMSGRLTVDAPFTMAVDSEGNPHLGIAGQIGRCTYDQDENISCPGGFNKPGELTLYSLGGNDSSYISWKMPGQVTQPYRLQPPADPPQDGQVMVWSAPDPKSHVSVGQWVTLPLP